MDLIRTALDKVGEKFNKGEKYAPLHALYEAPDTILYTPKDVTRGPSHVRDGLDLKRMMITVVVALMPCLFWGMYNVGYQAAVAVGQGAAPWDGWQTVIFEYFFNYDAGNVVSCMFHGALYFIPILLVTGLVGGHVDHSRCPPGLERRVGLVGQGLVHQGCGCDGIPYREATDAQVG